MKTRRPFIPLRKPIYIGCEGESEQSYVALLSDLANEHGLHVHLRVDLLGRGAGDPLARVISAATRLKQMRRLRVEPVHKFILLDRDQADQNLNRAAQAIALAAEEGLTIVWQDPCFEAVLLRHLPHRATHRPATTPLAMNAIEHEWPDYTKPMPNVRLATRIDLAAVRQAAGVEAGLFSLLACIGLIE